jgi:hypothetical protein
LGDCYDLSPIAKIQGGIFGVNEGMALFSGVIALQMGSRAAALRKVMTSESLRTWFITANSLLQTAEYSVKSYPSGRTDTTNDS